MGADNQAEKVIERIDRERDTFRLLAELRESGWSVGVHNDYRQGGKLWTFWLFTHPAGLFVKGEGATDLDALMQCSEAASKVFAPSP
jgi:hypothetical protein